MPGLNNMLRSLCSGLLVIMTSVAADAQPFGQDSTAEPILVGWISHTEGEVLRHDSEDREWVSVVKDSPFALNDSLPRGEGARAEIIIPNNTWIRIGDVTRIQAIELHIAFAWYPARVAWVHYGMDIGRSIKKEPGQKTGLHPSPHT